MAKAAQKATAEALASKDAEHAKAVAQAAAMQLTPNKQPYMNGATRQEPTSKGSSIEVANSSLHLRSALVDEVASILVEAVFKAIGSTQLGEQFARVTGTSRSPGMTQLRSTLAGLAQ